MKIIFKNISLYTILILSFLLVSCKKEEQGRPLSYNKGVYQGNEDNSLNGNEIYQLKKRVSGQSWY